MEDKILKDLMNKEQVSQPQQTRVKIVKILLVLLLMALIGNIILAVIYILNQYQIASLLKDCNPVKICAQYIPGLKK